MVAYLSDLGHVDVDADKIGVARRGGSWPTAQLSPLSEIKQTETLIKIACYVLCARVQQVQTVHSWWDTADVTSRNRKV